MFQEMGNARLAARLIGGADLVPHMGDHRDAVIGDHHHLQAIGQAEVVGLKIFAWAAALVKPRPPPGQ